MKVYEHLGKPISIYKGYIFSDSLGSLRCEMDKDHLGINLVHQDWKSYSGITYSLANGIEARLSNISMEHSLLVLMTIKIAEDHLNEDI